VLSHFERTGRSCSGSTRRLRNRLVEPLRGKAESERHFSGDRVGKPGNQAMTVSSKQPPFGFGISNTAPRTATRKSVRSTSANPPPSRSR